MGGWSRQPDRREKEYPLGTKTDYENEDQDRDIFQLITRHEETSFYGHIVVHNDIIMERTQDFRILARKAKIARVHFQLVCSIDMTQL